MHYYWQADYLDEASHALCAYAAAQAAMAADALRSGAPALNPKIADQTQITDLYKKAWA